MNTSSTGWLLLVITLPTESATARMRIWRALKILGGAALRDGTYLFPRQPSLVAASDDLCAEIRREGGSAWVLSVEAATPEEDTSFRNLFDRQAEYDNFLASLNEAQQSLASAEPGGANRQLRKLRKEYEAIRAIDYFPNEKQAHAEAAWMDFVQRVAVLQEVDEPCAVEGRIPMLDAKRYQSQRWATRKNIGVDRVCSAWLIARFIDPQATFSWLTSARACPKGVLGFDFDGATFTHVGDRVTFEVLVASFGLDKDPALLRLGTLVRSLDIGQGYVPEASGFDAMLVGLRQRAENDDTLLAQATPLLDALYASFSAG